MPVVGGLRLRRRDARPSARNHGSERSAQAHRASRPSFSRTACPLHEDSAALSFGIAVLLTVVCALYLRNAWEREHRSQLLALKGQADALVQAKEYEKAKGKYDEFFGLLGIEL